ncbi:MAG: TRZ/ATZ family hydrolase [Granulosicoccus sp.]
MQNSSTGSPAAPTLRIDAAWILPVDDHNRVLKDHSLIISDDRILDCLPTTLATGTYPDLSCVDRRQHILLPGFINAHTHLPMNLLRGLGSDQPLMRWLQDYIWPAEKKFMSPEFVHDGTQLALAESLLSGVTTVNDMYFYPDVIASACQNAGVRASIGLTVFDMETPWAKDASEYISKGLELHDQLRNNPLINTTLAPHAPYTVSVETMERIQMISSELDIHIHTHLHETAAEVNEYVEQHGVRPIEMLHRIGMLSPSLMAAHLTQLTENEIDLLAQTGVNVLHCPESNLKLASGFCPITRLAAKGVNISMGTDGAASNNDLDLLGETRTAALLAKAVSGDAASITARDALRMATINGAKALGISDNTGSLESGKSADMICIDIDQFMRPMHDVVAQVIYATGRERVSDVWVAGRHLLKKRQLLTMDTQQLEKTASKWEAKLATTPMA